MPTPTDDRITLSLIERPYWVVGSTGRQLRASMAILGPRREGHAFGAHTDWRIDYAFAPVANDGGFSASRISVRVEVVTTLPSYRPTRNASASLVDGFRGYVDALRNHERGHREVAVAAGSAILTALDRLGTANSVSELEGAAHRTAAAVLDFHRQRERHYDSATSHGKSQGVDFEAIFGPSHATGATP